MKLFSKVSFLVALFVGFQSFAQTQTYIPISDIEGMNSHWETLEKNGDVLFNGNRTQVSIPNSGTHLWFAGDLMRRGPYGIRTYQWVEQLTQKSPNQVITIIGNHDNIVSILSLLPSLELGLIPEYQSWLTTQRLENSLYQQISWWADRNGLKDKIENFWIELVANKLGTSPSDPIFRSSLLEDGKTSLDKLANLVSKDDFSSSFLQFIEPTGLGFRYLESASLTEVFDSPEGKRFLLLHCGTVTRGNLGVIPGTAENYMNLYPHEDWLKIWSQDLNAWKNQQLSRIKQLYVEIRKPQISREVQIKLAEELRSIHLIRYLDAGYDIVSKTFEYDANSVVYPNKTVALSSSIPAIPEPMVIDQLASAKVDFVVGGHIPIGDVAILRKGYSFGSKKFIQFILGDTSYSKVEGSDRLMFQSNGDLKMIGQTTSGKQIVVEEKNEATLQSWIESKDENLKFKASQIRKLGMVADGYLIVGFEGLTQADGSVSANYENLALLKQESYHFNYKVVDRWGMEGLTLKYPVSALKQLAIDAHEQKKKMLADHGKKSLSRMEWDNLVNHKEIIVSSGPANASLRDVLDAEIGNKSNVTQYLQSWKTYLLNKPSQTKLVLVSGGTTGLEAMKNEVAHEVNQIRAALGKSTFNIVGIITGITGGTELDPFVESFVISDAFYWDDYWSELLKMLQGSNYKSLEVQFAGGGSIVPRQIEETRVFKSQGFDLEITLTPGITSQKKLSATDKVVQEALNNPTHYQDLKITPLHHAQKKVGVFTGSFDPPHANHKLIAQKMKERFGLDTVYIVPDQNTQYKPNISEIEKRKEMIRIFFADAPGVELLDAHTESLTQDGEMWNILNAVQQTHPEDELFLIVGTDTLEWIKTVEPKNFSNSNFSILVNLRDKNANVPDQVHGRKANSILIESQEVSSSMVRAAIKDGTKPDSISDELYQYLLKNKLYGSNEGKITSQIDSEDCNSSLQTVN